MGFAGTDTTKKLKEFRRGRNTLPLPVTDEEYIKICKYSGKDTIGHFVSAAILWFESLERSDQAKRIWTVMRGERRATKSVSPISWVVDHLRSWNWPMATQGEVLNAVVMGFTELSTSDREEWLVEAMMEPVGSNAVMANTG